MLHILQWLTGKGVLYFGDRRQTVGLCGRAPLDRLACYAARPPPATERLSLLPDGGLLYRLKRRWRDGTSHVIFEPLELFEELAALVPPPRFSLVRYHGLLAPRQAGGRLSFPRNRIPALGRLSPSVLLESRSSIAHRQSRRKKQKPGSQLLLGPADAPGVRLGHSRGRWFNPSSFCKTELSPIVGISNRGPIPLCPIVVELG
jgi:hypothetical protein